MRWENLENEEESTVPRSHNSTKNWDKIGKEAEEEYNKGVEEGGGEAALQQMFKVFNSILFKYFSVVCEYQPSVSHALERKVFHIFSNRSVNLLHSKY